MKFKLFATKYADIEKIEKAVVNAVFYFPITLTVEFSEITELKEKETNKSLYELIVAWAMLLFRYTKSVSNAYLQSLLHEGYDGVILFLDKKKALETKSLYGQHSFINGKSYIQVYVNNDYVKLVNNGTEYGESYQKNQVGSIGDGTSHGLIHEVFHALSSKLGIPDILHHFIAEGQFDSYKGYLLAHMKPMNENGKILYETALSCLNTDVTPKDLVPDNVACAETLNAIYARAFGKSIGGGASTYNLYNSLLKHLDFTRVDLPLPGDIIISPTGYSKDGGKTLPNGHTGIVGENTKIMSNDSASGLFKANYTIQTWTDRYVSKGRYPMVFFRRK